MQRIRTLAVILVVAAGLALVVAGPPATLSAAVGGDAAAANFKAKCASCHGANGSGQTPYGTKAGLRDLRSPEVQRQSDQQLYDITAKGKGKMPGYEKSLGAAACRELVRYLRTLK